MIVWALLTGMIIGVIVGYSLKPSRVSVEYPRPVDMPSRNKMVPRCCGQHHSPLTEEIFELVFVNRMPWLYPVFFTFPLREHSLSTLLVLLRDFIQEKIRIAIEHHEAREAKQ